MARSSGRSWPSATNNRDRIPNLTWQQNTTDSQPLDGLTKHEFRTIASCPTPRLDPRSQVISRTSKIRETESLPDLPHMLDTRL